jgi:hypothetical protein
MTRISEQMRNPRTDRFRQVDVARVVSALQSAARLRARISPQLVAKAWHDSYRPGNYEPTTTGNYDPMTTGNYEPMTTGRGLLAGRLSAPRWLRGARQLAQGVTERCSELRTTSCACVSSTTNLLTDPINTEGESVRSARSSASRNRTQRRITKSGPSHHHFPYPPVDDERRGTARAQPRAGPPSAPGR